MLLSGRVARTLAPLALSAVLALGVSTLAVAQVLDGPDPAQMEDAPDLGYKPVPHGLQIPSDVEMVGNSHTRERKSEKSNRESKTIKIKNTKYRTRIKIKQI